MRRCRDARSACTAIGQCNRPADLYLEAGFGDAHGLPGFGPYLRAKYHLPPDAVAQLEAHFALINEKYHSRQDEQEAADA